MTDLRYVNVPGDLAMVRGRLVFLTPNTLEDRAQKVQQRLQFFFGEWFLDTRLGVPYFRDVFVKKPNPSLIRSTLRRVILSVPGVVRVDKMDLVINADRTARAEWQATWQDGATVGSALILGGQGT